MLTVSWEKPLSEAICTGAIAIFTVQSKLKRNNHKFT
jgi:hypothetical protein